MKIEATIIDQGHLTNKQAEVLRGVCEGKTNKEIAKKLCNEAKTVEVLLGQIYEKLGLKWTSLNNRCALVVYAIGNGLVKITFLTLLIGFCSYPYSSNISAFILPTDPLMIAASDDDNDDNNSTGSCGPVIAVSE